MTPAVSILVPIYNASNYIERCAHSVFQQTFDDIEYVFVNDCTPDDSIKKLKKVIEQYPNRKDKIKFIYHKKNQGIGVSRNSCIENALGKYIQFIDSDDYIEVDMIETMYKRAEEEQADIVVCDAIDEYKNKLLLRQDYVAESRDENFKNQLINEICQGFLWNKLIKRELYVNNKLRIPEGLNYMEDLFIILRLYYFAKKIVKIDRAFYHYVIYNANSITKNKTHKHFENVILFYSSLESFLKENNIFEKYKAVFEQQKLKLKIHLFFCTNISSLRYEYRNMFIEEEKKHWHTLKIVQKVMLFCSKRKYLLWGTQIIKKLLILKAKLYKK